MKIYNYNTILKEIVIKEKSVSFQLNRNNALSFKFSEIEKVFIKKRTFFEKYFLILGILFFILMAYLLESNIFTYCILGVLFYIYFLWLKNRQYSLILIVNEDEKHQFYFQSNCKFEFIEQIKIIRQKIKEEVFNASLKISKN
jgi:hypothetical protein